MGLKQQIKRVKAISEMSHRQLIVFTAGLLEAAIGKELITEEDIPTMIKKTKEQVK